MSAIAGLICPRWFALASDLCCVRLALIAGGGTVAANADSWALADAAAWLATCSARVAVALSQSMYDVAARVTAVAAGSSHLDESLQVTARKSAAAVYSWIANRSQAAAASIIDPAPGPPCIRPEFISGGSVPKSTAISFQVRRDGRLGRRHRQAPFRMCRCEMWSRAWICP